ncbi:TPA: endonuclease III [Candidatus Saccharibacteria bacterium]|nr:endonuclease III [Candidatus Saccharibacteria bacterium]
MQLSKAQRNSLRETSWEYYRHNGRSMPWRDDPTPYKVLVSELMLQQTQVTRVVPKFDAFLYTCPDFATLAQKSLGEVLALWSGLGYNRRAKYLHQTAQLVLQDLDGNLPNTTNELMKLPGIGKNTAGAILAYAYNQPVVFVETNIRTVFFHHFYDDQSTDIGDKELEALVAKTLDQEHPREWYWALMDYGSFLKKTAGGKLTSSRHYVKQSPLSGSPREMRGRIIKALVGGPVGRKELFKTVDGDDRFESALSSLIRDGMVVQNGELIGLTGADKTS